MVIYLDGAVRDMHSAMKSEVYDEDIGDKLFLDEMNRLDQSISIIGRQLLLLIRRDVQGNLKSREKFKKFIETPTPFWMIQIKPRLNSFYIVVFGKPNEHDNKYVIDLKPYMESFSYFFLAKHYQIFETVKAVRDAKKLYQLKKMLHPHQ